MRFTPDKTIAAAQTLISYHPAASSLELTSNCRRLLVIYRFSSSI